MSKIPRIVLLIEKSRTFGRGLLRGVTRYSGIHGPWMFYERPEFYRGTTKPLAGWIKTLGVDGIIGHTADQKLANLSTDLNIPAVICGIRTPASSTCRIDTDSVAIGDMAASYFLGRGFRQFAFCGLDDMYWSRDRCDAFAKRLAQSGFDLSIYKQNKTVARKRKDGPQVMAEWLKSLPKPLALMTCNDDRSKDVLAACRIAGIQVPDEVAVLGVDNDDLTCAVSYPELSSIALDTEKAGYEAAQLLEKLMTDGTVDKAHTTVYVAPKYVVTRQSTDVMAIQDRCVATAVGFILEHRNERIQVNDVAEATGVSRRMLQQKFSTVLGRSVHEEIRHIRIEQMARMLVDTDLSVSQIANLLGYSYVRNISRWFQKQKKTTPAAYRKVHRS
jgi:LacI family transcriptional regulator